MQPACLTISQQQPNNHLTLAADENRAGGELIVKKGPNFTPLYATVQQIRKVASHICALTLAKERKKAPAARINYASCNKRTPNGIRVKEGARRLCIRAPNSLSVRRSDTELNKSGLVCGFYATRAITAKKNWNF
jgi:hypothetical protein